MTTTPMTSTTTTTSSRPTEHSKSMCLEAILSQFEVIMQTKTSTVMESRTSNVVRAWVHWQLNVGCTFHTFTTVLGYCLIALVTLAHVPLLFNILRSRNGKNYISPISISLLVLTSSNYVSYAVYKHLPISTWGEGIVQLMLYIIITNLMLLHDGRHKQAVTFTFLYVLAMMVILLPLVPGYLVVCLKMLNLSINLTTKVVCVFGYHNQQGCTAQVPVLSSILFLNVCSFGRLLTAAVDTHDLLFVLCYGQDCALNGVLTIQAVRRKRKKSKAVKRELKCG